MLMVFMIASWTVGDPLYGDPIMEKDLEYRLQNLEMLLRAIDHVKEGINAVQSKMQSGAGIGREQELRKQIADLGEKQASLEASFRRLAADVDEIYDGAGLQEKKFEWQKEIIQLLAPLLREINKITERPRQIEELRNKIESYQVELSRSEKALKNISNLIQSAKRPALRGKLEEHLGNWRGQQDEIRTRMNIAERELERHLRQQKTISESLRDFFRIFFKSRGRNLICSVMVFAVIWFGLYFLYKPIRRYSPFHTDERSVYIRLFDLTYFVVATVLALLGLLAVLYFFHDWVLLTIAVLFLFGIAWASKQAIPYVWLQAKMMLNLGPVREGEVIVYRGLPYEVRSLNFYSQLENSALQGGAIRVPIKDLMDHRSRPQIAGEPWFPSRTGEWVTLKDGGHGRVVVQTPETVEIQQPGGGSVFYKTTDFLCLRPVNLSKGFRLWITFPLGHENLPRINEDIPRVFETDIPAKLVERGYGNAMRGLQVVFKGAARSALEILIMADFSGTVACDYKVLHSVLSGVCMDVCNRHNWRPPFHQIRVHGIGSQY